MTVIPPMTDPLGRYWDQPKTEDILVDDVYAVMTKKTLDQLADYTRSQPSGVYQGKMWRTKELIFSERDGQKYVKWTGNWKLCWFGPDLNDEPGYVGNYYRLILLID